MGVDTFKTDFGERIPTRDVVYYDGSDPIKMHNFYTYLYNECVFNVLKEYFGENKACLFARSATAGGQKFLFTGAEIAQATTTQWLRL